MEKIKQFIESEKGKDVMVVIIIILVALGSFEIGRLSKKGNSTGLKVEYNGKEIDLSGEANALSAVETDKSPNQKTFFASSRGSKYYSVGCSAGKTIKQENRIYFATGEEAEQAGYVLSSSCR